MGILDNYSPHQRKNIQIASLFLFGMILVGSAIFVLFSRGGSTPPTTYGTACLTVDDYKDLTGVTRQDELLPTENFYTYSVDFERGTDKYTDGVATKKILKDLVAFYKSHEAASILVTLTSDYTTSSGEETATERIQRLTDDLVKYGMNENLIRHANPDLIVDSEDVEPSFATITLTSTVDCNVQ